MQKLTIVALALIAYSVTMGGVILAQNESETETVGTGQESVPVETTTGQVEQAAPADAIDSLLTTIFTVAIPAVTGLIIAIASIVKSRSTNKNVQANADELLAAVRYIDTIAPKIHDQFVASGATKAGLSLVVDKLAPEDRAKLTEITDKIPDADAKIRELSAQINDFRARIPENAKADNDPSIPRLIGSRAKTDVDKQI